MTKYVCGFYFDHLLKQVVLIWKDKPAWQKDKLNGVGGKIEEGETPAEAMQREFKEETGIDHNSWTPLIRMSGSDWSVNFFCAIGREDQFEYAETQEEEEVTKIDVDRLDDYAHIDNLRWLIPMAINKLKSPLEVFSFDYETAITRKQEVPEAVQFAEWCVEFYGWSDTDELWVDNQEKKYTTAELFQLFKTPTNAPAQTH